MALKDKVSDTNQTTSVELTLAVVVPLLNELKSLPAMVASLDISKVDHTVIVDGGSRDGSYQWLKENWVGKSASHTLLQSSTGRALQMNSGARCCTEDVILFLHADTQLPLFVKSEVLLARSEKRLWGRFDVQFSVSGRYPKLMKVVATFMNGRSRLTGIATGDQAIFIDRELFESVEGFPLLPLMEDIAMSKQLKQHYLPYCSKSKVTTSPRRWEQDGVVKTIVLMWSFRLAFYLGVSAEYLDKTYKHIR